MLGPVDVELSARFTRNCATAAFGYAKAATAVYAAAANQALDFWATAAKRAEPQRGSSRQSYLVGRPSPPAPLPTPSPFDYFSMTNPWLDERSPAYASIRAWWGMFPLEGNPSSWPMAYSLMTAGVPREVALPTAEANIAAFEAADVAKEAVNKALASYRAATIPEKPAAPALFDTAMLGPFGAMMNAWMSFGRA